MTCQVQIKFMNLQRRYLVRIIQFALIQCHCNLVPVAAFAVFHFQLFAFPYAFQFEQGDQHSPPQTSAGQNSSKKIQLLSRRLPDLICFGGTLFPFELWAKNHQGYDHR